jgi:hypothetical protein
MKDTIGMLKPLIEDKTGKYLLADPILRAAHQAADPSSSRSFAVDHAPYCFGDRFISRNFRVTQHIAQQRDNNAAIPGFPERKYDQEPDSKARLLSSLAGFSLRNFQHLWIHGSQLWV